MALRRRFGRVHYWREKGEVDFVIQAQGRIVPVQATWDESTERHLRALDEFYGRFPQAEEAVFVTVDTFEKSVARLTELFE